MRTMRIRRHTHAPELIESNNAAHSALGHLIFLCAVQILLLTYLLTHESAHLYVV